MRPNPLLDRFAASEVALGAWLSVPSSIAAETVAVTGFDYVCVDMQHGLVDYSDSVLMLQAITTGSSTPLVRVPENQSGHIGKALDAGAMGVIVPMVNSVEECEAAVRAARYAPEGSRSYGPTRVRSVEGADYYEHANRTVAVIPMIETVAAVEAIEGILAVEGVDAIYVGPGDLSISLGLPPANEEPEFHAALDTIVAACERHDVVPGIHTTPTGAADRIRRGYRMLTVTADLVALRTKVAADLAFVREGGSESAESIY